MYKVEVKPGVGFSQLFSTRVEALIFIRDLNEAFAALGILPFRCEVIDVKARDEDAGDEEPRAFDEEEAPGGM